MRLLLLTLSITAAVLLPSLLGAQEDGSLPPALAEKLEKIAQRLQLTDEQRPQVVAVLLEVAAHAAEYPPTTPEEKRALRRKLRIRVLRLLPPEQQELLRKGKHAKASSQPPGTERAESSSGTANGFTAQFPAGTTVTPEKRHWLDFVLDEILVPLLSRRQ